ncbi:MAG: hypothetical protein Q9195_008106 [Heterodermia aff. obscurata]
MAGSGHLPLVATSTKYSTLESVKHDADTTAPKDDRAVFASDSDRHLDAPQVAPVPGFEVFYSDTPPEALNNIRNKSPTASDSSADSYRPSSRMTIIVTAIIAALLVGTAVGVGVGVGLKKQRSGNDSSTIVMSTVTRTASTSILDDTSVAALTFSDGDTHLFFQDLSGIIRQASYNGTLREWRADIGDVVASDAKNHTPIAVATTSTAYTQGNVNHPSASVCVSMFFTR